MNPGHPNPFVRQWPDLPWPPPTSERDDTRVIVKKVWTLADIQAIAQAQLDHEDRPLLAAINDDCVKDIQNLEFTVCDVAERVLQLEERHYDKSMWCMRSKRPGTKIPDEHLWLPCDAYQIRIKERKDSTGWEGMAEYYFKLCLSPAKKILILVSIHL